MSNSFIISHESLLEEEGRLRVANQLLAVLEDWYGGKSLKELTVLDYGCSNGVITNFIATHVKKIVGIDIDEIAIQKAKKKYNKNNLSFVLTNNIKVPFKDASFNLIICNQVYSYLDDPNLMMSEIYRVTKKSGICLFTGDNLLRPIEPLYNLPFIRLLPKNLTKIILRSLGYKNIYLGQYKTYWGLKQLVNKFTINDYTIKILKNPKKYKYQKIEKYSTFFSITPSFILKTIEPFLPSFIFLLQKD